VIDPFAGSGTCAVVANKALGRRFATVENCPMRRSRGIYRLLNTAEGTMLDGPGEPAPSYR
jgi:hypothetical protein